MKRAIQPPVALIFVSISVWLLAVVLIVNKYAVFEPGSVALFAVGLVSLAIARR